MWMSLGVLIGLLFSKNSQKTKPRRVEWSDRDIVKKFTRGMNGTLMYRRNPG